MKNIKDNAEGGTIGNTDFYGVTSAGANSQNLFICNNVIRSSSLYYCFHLESCRIKMGFRFE